jgi:hypothetical protein
MEIRELTAAPAAVAGDRPIAPPQPPRAFGMSGSLSAWLCVAGLWLLGLGYGFAWYRHCHLVSLWMDEVLAAATARLPQAGDIVAAIWSGAEFSPPSFDLLLHVLGVAAPGAGLAIRLPSFLAVGATGLVVAACLRRVAGGPLAVVGCGLTWSGGLFYFAIQARPYALLALCLALALWLWLGLPARRPAWRAGALWVLGAVAISLHVYGVLIPACIGTAELFYAAAARRWRWPVWLALIALLPVLAAWAPLYLHLAHLNAADQSGPVYYGRPDLPALAFALDYMLVPHSWRHGPFALAALLAVAIAATARLRRPRDDEVRRWRCALLALAMLPVIAFGISLFITGTFAARYISGVALLPALAVPYALRDLRPARLIACLLVPAIAWSMVAEAAGRDWAAPTDEMMLVARAPPAPRLIVIDQGQEYIQLVEALPPALRARCVFVLTAPGIARPDPTNENQVRRLAGFLPHYQLWSVPALLAAAPSFLLIFRPDQPGSALASLRAAGARFTPLARAGGETLYLGRAP